MLFDFEHAAVLGVLRFSNKSKISSRCEVKFEANSKMSACSLLLLLLVVLVLDGIGIGSS